MDLVLDRDAFRQASSELARSREDLERLRAEINRSVDQLRRDWNSEAGRQFFQRFENDMLKNLDENARAFQHMSNNLTLAMNRYQEVFDAADAVANSQY